jgi:hypothetical protein
VSIGKVDVASFVVRRGTAMVGPLAGEAVGVSPLLCSTKTMTRPILRALMQCP